MKFSHPGTQVKLPSPEQIKPLATTHEQPFPLPLYHVIDSSAPEGMVDCPHDPIQMTEKLLCPNGGVFGSTESHIVTHDWDFPANI
jgi:hypothetical protein